MESKSILIGIPHCGTRVYYVYYTVAIISFLVRFNLNGYKATMHEKHSMHENTTIQRIYSNNEAEHSITMYINVTEMCPQFFRSSSP